MLIGDYKNIRQIEHPDLLPEEESLILDSLKVLPRDVQSLVLRKNGPVILTNFPELHNVKSFNDDEAFWSFIKNTSNDYFYQFTTINAADKNDFFIVTRIPRNKSFIKQKGYEKVMLIFSIFLIILVITCVLIIIYISRTIFRSIKLIETQTQELASGDLNIDFDTSNKAKNEITSITDSLEQMRLSLYDAQTRKNKFIMGISHDLRSPIAVIKGYTEAISDGIIKEEEIPQTLDLISTKAGQLGSMINTLINFVKLDASTWYQNLKNENISELIKHFAHDSEITGALFKREVTSLIDLPNAIYIPMDSQLVGRVLENLFSNAVRYTHEEDSIHISAYEHGNNVILEISDTGCGMTEEDLNHIFDLFYRGTSSRREEGMGIGLSVVKSIIDTLNWRITVESKVGEGSTFSIFIPKCQNLEENKN